ncbi:MBL fold metallo-hydrolase [Microbacter sp. GSS18]|nr:MBL fold metallo-hydrolase [Microbacter sp. GSS18]
MSTATSVRSTIGAHYVEPSATQKLTPGDKIADLYARNMQGAVLQRLTDRVWWVAAFNYQTVFYVGDEGVLLFDALEGVSPLVTAAIHEVTDLPITAVVYSHYHADHIGDIAQYVDAATEGGFELRIIASTKSLEKMQLVKSSYPLPTETVAWPDGSFAFEDLEVSLHGFEWAAHTDDHSAWLLEKEGVVHSPDLINPDQPPFWRFAGNERFLFSDANLRAVRDLEWTFLSGGHGNVGYREDIDFDLAFMADLTAAVGAAMGAHAFTDFIDPEASAHTGFLAQWISAVAREAVATLRPTYGDLYGFEDATLPNAEMVAFSMFEHR